MFLSVITFIDLLQTDNVAVVPSKLLFDQVLSVVQLQGVGGAVRVQHRLGKVRLGVDVGEDVVRHHSHSRPVRDFGCESMTVVKQAHAWSSLHSSHRNQLLGQATTASIFGCAAQFEPEADVLIGWDVNSLTSNLSPTTVLI